MAQVGLGQHSEGIKLFSSVYGLAANIDMFESGKCLHVVRLPRTLPSQTGLVLSLHSNTTPFGSSKRKVAAGARVLFSVINNFPAGKSGLLLWRLGRPARLPACNLWYENRLSLRPLGRQYYAWDIPDCAQARTCFCQYSCLSIFGFS